MDMPIPQKIKELLSQNQRIGVVVGDSSNVDHVAAALGFYLSLKQLGKHAIIASPTTLQISTPLIGMEQIKDRLATENGDLTVSFPYKEGEIEKVSYTLDNGYLNIVVKAADKGLSFQDQEVLFRKSGKPFHILFFIGIPKRSDIDKIYDAESIKDAVIVNIDNKEENEKYGDLVIVSPTASSVSEQVADLLTLLDGSLSIDEPIAQNLLSGIIHATEDFTSADTSHLAFEMAGILMRKGAKRNKLPHTAKQIKSENTFIPPRVQKSEKAPADWLAPKVYKGSTAVE
jgi:nanoRNase/pAp phosphatase (c-di-AMP/oligoRNAs hydrolase)